jgi:hypothetical protein
MRFVVAALPAYRQAGVAASHLGAPAYRRQAQRGSPTILKNSKT